MYPDQSKIEKMKIAADICSDIYKQIIAAAKPGTTLLALDKLAEQLCSDNKVLPAFKGYEGFPATLCVSPNDIVVHGIPDQTKIKEGDVLGIDLGIKYQDVYSDMSYTIAVGGYKDEVTKKFVETVKKATLAGIAKAIPGNKVGDIGAAMQEVVESNGYSVVKEMVGHGVGYELHEDPNIPGYGKKGRGELLYKGQTLAIEAIVNQGSADIFIDSEDGWTTYTEDGMLSAIFEHTIIVDEDPVILTKW
ncbi:MAG: type I methionyl aminopeptidase [Candidatus Dojkabacteria bacterium]